MWLGSPFPSDLLTGFSTVLGGSVFLEPVPTALLQSGDALTEVLVRGLVTAPPTFLAVPEGMDGELGAVAPGFPAGSAGRGDTEVTCHGMEYLLAG